MRNNISASSGSSASPAVGNVRPGGVSSPLKEKRAPIAPGPTPAPPIRFYSSLEIAEVTGATLRQLQWWDEKGCIKPRHAGHFRRWDLLEGVLCSIVMRLKTAGDSIQRIRKVLKVKAEPCFGHGVNNGTALFLVVTPKRVRWAFSAEGAVDKNEYSMIISIQEIVESFKALK